MLIDMNMAIPLSLHGQANAQRIRTINLMGGGLLQNTIIELKHRCLESLSVLKANFW
jgi:hypothetical protein